MSRNYFDDLADRLDAMNGVGVEWGLSDAPHPSGMTAAALGRILYKRRDFFADADREVEGEMSRYFGRALEATYAGLSPARALEDLADVAASALYTSIDTYYAVPNAPSTIRRKGFDKPLYDFGDLLKCVIAVVVDDAGADAGEAAT